MDLHGVIQRPLVTEKSSIAREESNIATFRVDPAATKHEIRRAVEELFEVKVENVRTMNQPGKKRRVGKKVGRKPSWKKAIVELAEATRSNISKESEPCRSRSTSPRRQADAI